MAEAFANSEDPDQMPHSVASDLGLHCLPVTLLGVSRLQYIKFNIHMAIPWPSYPVLLCSNSADAFLVIMSHYKDFIQEDMLKPIMQSDLGLQLPA